VPDPTIMVHHRRRRPGHRHRSLGGPTAEGGLGGARASCSRGAS